MTFSDTVFCGQREPVWAFDPETFKILKGNEAAAEMYGCASEDFLGMTLFDLWPVASVAMRAAVNEGVEGALPALVWRVQNSGQIWPARLSTVRISASGAQLAPETLASVSSAVRTEDPISGAGVRQATRASPVVVQQWLGRLFEASPLNMVAFKPWGGGCAIPACTETFANTVSLGLQELSGQALFDMFGPQGRVPEPELVASILPLIKRVGEAFPTHIMLREEVADEAGSVADGASYYLSIRGGPATAEDGPFAVLYRLESAADLVAAEEAVERLASERVGPHSPLSGTSRSVQTEGASDVEFGRQAASLRTAQKFLNLWVWQLNLETMKLEYAFNPVAGPRIQQNTLPETFGDYLTCVHPDDRQKLVESMERVKVWDAQTFEFEHRTISPNKTVVWLSGLAETAYSGDDRVLRGVARNVTEEMENNSRLKLMSASVSLLNDIVLITEAGQIDAPTGPRIIFVNEAFEKWTGYSREEAVGQTPRMLQGPMSSRAKLDEIRDALKAGRPIRTEIVNYDKAGHPFWVEIDIVPLSDGGERHTHHISVMRDISQRKKAEEYRTAAEERFRLVTQATNDVIWDRCLEAGQTWWNRNYCDVFGYPLRGECERSEDWFTKLVDKDQPRVRASLDRFLESSKDVWADEYRVVRADGKVRWVADRAVVVRDAEGRAVRMVGSIVDFTDRRELEERVNQSERLESLGQLTGGIAHDFNNLLTVLLGNSESLAKRLSPGPLKEMADLSLAACESAGDLVSRLLSFARRQPLDPIFADINERLTQTSALLRRILPESIRLDMTLSPDIGIVSLDLSQFDTAIINLCINARDAMPKGGVISIESEEVLIDQDYAAQTRGLAPGRYVLVSISDNGAGMDQETADRAFEPFFTTKPVGSGSGLGLSMVYGFVKQSGGNATIYSEPGHGTRINLYFPRAQVDHPDELLDESLARYPLAAIKVLVVEDNEFVMAHVRRLMTELGLDIVSSSTGARALEILREQPDISLLFTDIVLPGGMNGDALAREARAMLPDLHVIYTTGYTQHTIGNHGELDKDIVLLTKPYRRADLQEKLMQVLHAMKEKERRAK